MFHALNEQSKYAHACKLIRPWNRSAIRAIFCAKRALSAWKARTPGSREWWHPHWIHAGWKYWLLFCNCDVLLLVVGLLSNIFPATAWSPFGCLLRVGATLGARDQVASWPPELLSWSHWSTCVRLRTSQLWIHSALRQRYTLKEVLCVFRWGHTQQTKWYTFVRNTPSEVPCVNVYYTQVCQSEYTKIH